MLFRIHSEKVNVLFGCGMENTAEEFPVILEMQIGKKVSNVQIQYRKINDEVIKNGTINEQI